MLACASKAAALFAAFAVAGMVWVCPAQGGQAPRPRQVIQLAKVTEDGPVSPKMPTTQPFAKTPTTQPGDEKSIPLDTIWAYKVEGTQPMAITLVEGRPSTVDGKLLAEIIDAFSSYGNDVRRAFLVADRGLSALQNAHGVIVNKKEPLGELKRGQKASLIFWSYQPAEAIHFQHVACTGNTIDVSYYFAPTESRNTVAQLAIIPVEINEKGGCEIRFVCVDPPKPDKAPDEPSVDPRAIAFDDPSILDLPIMDLPLFDPQAPELGD